MIDRPLFVKFIYLFPLLCLTCLCDFSANAQQNINPKKGDELLMTLNDCVHYALKNQPTVNQNRIDEAIADYNKKIALTSWMPQATASAGYQNYLNLPSSFSTFKGAFAGAQVGVFNYLIPQLNVSQNIFSNEALFANRIADLSKTSALQNTEATKINLVATVSKAFYDLLLSIEKISVYKEDTARLAKNQSDAYFRYKSGLVDKVDYKQATISLNNTRAQLKGAIDAIDAKKAFLKELMGLPEEKTFNVLFDTAKMLQEIYVDTLAPLVYDKRIEYKQLLIAKNIQRQNSLSYKYSWLPTASAYYNYFYEMESQEASNLLKNAFPYSLFGLQMSIPIFSGLKRTDNIRKSKLMEDRIDMDFLNLQLTITTQYQQALADYKSNLYFLNSQRENEELAKEVYEIVKLQYREGVKTYLDVIVAETDLQTSEINYLNALFQLLESKVNVELALGNISTAI